MDWISSLLLATVRLAIPVLLISLAELYGQRAGMVNIGLEGLASIGALVGFLVCYVTGSNWLGLLCGALAGVIVNMIYAFSTVTLCADHTVYGMAVNIFAPALASFIYRVYFATIRIKDWETEELTTTLVVAYHQDGIQAAIGPCVKICHNQCILSPERSVCNYGKKKVTTEEVFDTVDEWMANFEVNMSEDIERIRRLKRRIIPLEEVYMYIGLLTALRVSHDSADRNLSSSVETYPLNQGQISVFTEEVLKLVMEKGQITAWELYNIATNIYKPGKTDFPALIPQNGAMAELLLSRLSERAEVEEAVLLG